MKTRMDQNGEQDANAALSSLLAEWRADSTHPPGFRDAVWNRIARKQKVEAAPGWLLKLVAWVRMEARPGFAAAYLTLLILCGVTAGSLTGSAYRDRVEKELGRRYVHELSPTLVASVMPAQ